jgi:hypothetical protein
MEYHYSKMILDFISSISWPIACFSIIMYFRKPLTRFLKKIQKVSYGETSIERHPKKQKDEKSKIDIMTKGHDFTYIDETLNKFSETSKGFALQIIENETKLSEVEDAEQKSERILKYSQLLIIVKSAETTYQLIYGSQIRLLQKLNYSPETAENLKYFYDNAMKYFPEIYENYTYENYLNFLVRQGLIIINEEADRIAITEVGKDFLRYLVESNSSLDKLY